MSAGAEKGENHVITAEDVQNAIGQTTTHAAVVALLAKLGPGTKKKEDGELTHRHKNDGMILVEDQGRVARIFLKAKGGGLKQYSGEMPRGLKFGQTQAEVEELLGEPTKRVGTFIFEYDQGLWTLNLDFDDDKKLQRVALLAR
jgi:hypothetical protein